VLAETAPPNTPSQGAPTVLTQDQTQKSTPSDSQIAAAIKQYKDLRKSIEDEAKAEDDLDFALVLGIGSLIKASNSTDYSNEANVLHSNNIGRATPQLLTGVSFRSKIPNFPKLGGKESWQQRPWNAFVSVKCAPNSSQTINGFVFGASYSAAKYMNILVGYPAKEIT
jgi:hypothetical protein